MRRLYKRDFLNMDYDTSSCDSTGFERGDDIQQGTSDSESRTLELDKSIREATLDEGEYSKITSDEKNQGLTRSTSFYTESTESEECIEHEEILTQADVHTAVVKMSKRSLRRRYSSKEWDNSSRGYLATQTDVSSSTGSKLSYTGPHETEAGQEVMEELVKTTEASPRQASSSPRHDKNDECTPELVRRRQTIYSEYSLSHHEIPICGSNDSNVNESFGIDIAHAIASGSEMEIANSSLSDFNMYCTVTSTPKSLKKISSPRSRIIKRYRKRLVSYSTSSIGSKDAKRQAALQTSFSDDEPAWKDLWKNFFVGLPVVYNICSCNNHVCS
ncbi:uncharacterized protein LOC124541397 [Vanessa cardui]|uniref:uncharacterized protein LOC124541397 n=1 Tax=Vanessa cardui TaxID=171605 RepID=UPI001F12F5AB|nr:uncharacterized protein LOC124541397 [Vanessa cardui]